MGSVAELGCAPTIHHRLPTAPLPAWVTVPLTTAGSRGPELRLVATPNQGVDPSSAMRAGLEGQRRLASLQQC